MQTSKILATFSLASFAATTLWAVTVEGYLEPMSLNVAHLDAGAGNGLFLIRALLALTCTITCFTQALQSKQLKYKVSMIVLSASVLPIFIWSCSGIERWAPNFSQEAFDKLSDQFYQHDKNKTSSECDGLHDVHVDKPKPAITKEDVARLVSKPLFQELCNEPLSKQEETVEQGYKFTRIIIACDTKWSYTYMPSGGFGWSKRIVIFKDNLVTDVVNFNEP